jgi:hypothetical protein
MSSRILGWLLPVLCIIGATVALIIQFGRVIGAQLNFAKADDDVKKAIALNSKSKDITQYQRRIGPMDGPTEETRFVSDLNSIAKIHNVTLLKLSSRAQAFGAGVLDSRGYRYTLEDDKTLTGVKKIYAELSVGGSYANIRAFLRDFENSQRMYTISNVKWSRTDSATELGVVLARYVLMNVPLAEESAEQTKEG